MVTPKNGESRKDYLLRVVIEFIEDNCLEYYDVDYDGTTCDGYCLIEDIKNELEL